MNDIAKMYGILSGYISKLLERITENDLQKAKRNFQKTYKESPTEKEEIEIKKAIVMRKIGGMFIPIFLVTWLLLNI